MTRITILVFLSFLVAVPYLNAQPFVALREGDDLIVKFEDLSIRGPLERHIKFGVKSAYTKILRNVDVMTVVNLRGVKEAGRIFAVPTYFFLGMAFLMLIVGVIKFATGTLVPVPLSSIPDMIPQGSEALTLFLLLRAFSSGCTALTGVEAISNGITAFKTPKSKNAAITLTWMSGVLIVLFLGFTVLAKTIGAYPSTSETVISQMARAVFGNGSILYFLLLAGTSLILLMAANTSYADFPRLAALAAGDGFLPRQLTFRGSRLVFSWGINTLGVLSGLLIVFFRADTTALIPLYAIGVFLSFTMSQSGIKMLGIASSW